MKTTITAETVPPHEFLLKLLAELKRGENLDLLYGTQLFVIRMMTESTIPDWAKSEVADAFIEFAASGNMSFPLAENFAKAYLRLDPKQVSYLDKIGTSNCGTDEWFKHLRVLGVQLDKREVEETVNVPARPGLYEGATVPLSEA